MKICVVLVTYNRLEMLKVALAAFVEQTRLPDQIIVVNNASSDGTKEYLEEWYKDKQGLCEIHLIHNVENCGGSGGFYTGFEAALKLENDWIWVSDDDAFPEKNVLEELQDKIEHESISSNDISAVCTQVRSYGRPDCTHRTRLIKGFCKMRFLPIEEQEYSKEKFLCGGFSYVGTMINRKKLLEQGITRYGYFIWHDDKEHAYRLSKSGKIICYPNVIVNHDVEQQQDELTWKTFYGLRNELLIQKEHFSERYYWFLKQWFFFKRFLSKDPIKKEMIKAAIIAADNNQSGQHPLYRPGWKR